MATGEQEQADHLIAEALAAAKPVNYGDSLLHQPILHAVGRDDRQALDAILRYLDAGGSPYRLMWQNELKPFKDNPEYQALAEKRKAELAIQQNRIREMEANGELAPIPELPAN